MRRLRALDLSLEEIAARVGRTGACVSVHVRDMQVRLPPGRPGMNEATKMWFLAAAEAGATRHDMAARFGLAPRSVAPLLSRLRKMRRLASSQEARAC